MKITKVESSGHPEFFQRFSHDPYLGKSGSSATGYQPASDFAARPLGVTIREKYLTHVRKIGKILVESL